MWTRTYLLLLAVRLYFALSPSYIHPDENFQGPEVIAGRIFSFPNHLTWEWTSDYPVRSAFPLWPVYALPMLVLQWIWTGIGERNVGPEVIYYSLRVVMFILSFVLEDWALHELVQSPRQRRLAVTLVASSYVTWTYQTHTFSNSIESLVVLWSLVMLKRLLDSKKKNALLSPAILGALLTFGVFNRITFPAWFLLPGVYLVPYLCQRFVFISHSSLRVEPRIDKISPLSLLAFVSTAFTMSVLAIITDTDFHRPSTTLANLPSNIILTPLNSLLYNFETSNLAQHGIHPVYQHLIASLPLLLGPAIFLFPSIKASLTNPTLPILSAISGIAILSAFPHQEPRFLLPVVPLILTSIQLPKSRRTTQVWLATWVFFNMALGVIMGIYHQGGVIPTQIWLGQQIDMNLTKTTQQVFWWRTYSPPIWLLDHSPLNTTNLMGMPLTQMQAHLETALGDGATCHETWKVALVAPISSLELDAWRDDSNGLLVWEEVWRYGRHLNLDDLDFGGKRGVFGELERLVSRNGLGVWTIGRTCR